MSFLQQRGCREIPAVLSAIDGATAEGGGRKSGGKGEGERESGRERGREGEWEGGRIGSLRAV